MLLITIIINKMYLNIISVINTIYNLIISVINLLHYKPKECTVILMQTLYSYILYLMKGRLFLSSNLLYHYIKEMIIIIIILIIIISMRIIIKKTYTSII